MTATYDCVACKVPHPLLPLLRGARKLGGGVPAFRSHCPAGEALDFSVEGGALHFGYVYAAGAPHFCAMVRVEVPGLSVGPGPVLSYAGQRIEVGVK